MRVLTHKQGRSKNRTLRIGASTTRQKAIQMLYKFKSKVTGDVIMLQPNGQHVLEIIGKHSAAEPSVKGILLPEQMPEALHKLELAIVHEETARREAIATAQAEHLPPPRFETIGLRQRALPLMDMLRQCQQDGEPITWGV